MFIKYKNDIYNLNNYESLHNAGEFEIQLVLLHENNVVKLSFNNKAARDFIMSEIWNSLTNNCHCYDADYGVDNFYREQKYNLV